MDTEVQQKVCTSRWQQNNRFACLHPSLSPVLPSSPAQPSTMSGRWHRPSGLYKLMWGEFLTTVSTENQQSNLKFRLFTELKTSSAGGALNNQILKNKTLFQKQNKMIPRRLFLSSIQTYSLKFNINNNTLSRLEVRSIMEFRRGIAQRR